MRKIIPMVDPPITTYPAIANILSLKWGKDKNAEAWVMDHFIQLIARPRHEHTFGDFYDHADIDNFFRIIFGLPGLGWMRVNKDVIQYDKFTDYIECEIDKNYCIEACLDRYFFEFSEDYNTTHHIHSSLIYGYDNEKKEIYIADFFRTGKYEKKIVSYDEMNACMNNDWLMNLYKDENIEYKYNEELVSIYFEDYLNARDSFNKFRFSNKDYNDDAIFGVGYYDYLITCLDEGHPNDFRMYNILCDHKKLMKYRLEYMSNLQKYDSDKMVDLQSKNDKLITESKILLAYYLKYIYKQNEQKKDMVKSKILSLKENDIKFVKEILETISVVHKEYVSFTQS